MKKGTLIALLILGGLGVVYFATRKAPQTGIESPKETIPEVKDVARVEITRPDGKLVVLEKKDQKWFLSKPWEVGTEKFRSDQMNATFGAEIRMDDLKLSEQKLDDYYLSKEKAYKIAYFKPKSAAPAVEFFVGKELSGSKTTRSYIKTIDGKLFRAKSDIASIVRLEPERLRTGTIFATPSPVQKVTIRRRDGQKTILVHADKKWSMEKPTIDFPLFEQEMNFLEFGFKNLRSIAFADTNSDKEMDLAPPFATAIAEFEDGTNMTFEIGHPAPKKYFIRKKNDNFTYEVRKEQGRVLCGNYLAYKMPFEHDIPVNEVLEFHFTGPQKLVIKRTNKDEEWKSGKTKINQTKIPPVLGSFAHLITKKWHDISVKDAGLDKPSGKIVIKTKDKEYTLLIGNAFKKNGDRYAKWANSKYVMEIPIVLWERATTRLSDLELEERK